MSPATRLGCLLFIPLSLYEKTPAIFAALATLCGAVFAADNAPAPAARDGLLLEYKFEGDAADSSGHARAGKVHGHPTFATGRAGQCLVLDGGGAFIETSLTSADLGQTFTVDCWVKPDSRQNTHADIFGNHEHGGVGFVIQQDGASANRYRASYGTGSDRWVLSRPVQLAAGKWQHVAIVKTPQAITFFLNGVVVASASGSASLAASTLPLRVGLGFRADQENRTFRGCIDEFRVWNTAVTKFDLELSEEEKRMPIAESLRIEWHRVPAAGADEPQRWEFSLPAELTAAVRESVPRIDVAVEAVPWASNRAVPPEKVVLTAQAGYRATVEPQLPPGAYTVTASPSTTAGSTQIEGAPCRFTWIATGPVAELQAIRPSDCTNEWVAALSSRRIPLDGPDWQIAIDPSNSGRQTGWFESPPAETRPTKVPWVIQDVFHGYHGVAWYWREFTAPANPRPDGRTILRFEAVDYLAEVWVNGQRVGGHEGGETPFELDVTSAIRAGAKNLLAVRVLNPTYEPIDGYALKETPSAVKHYPITGNATYNAGGIVDSVSLLLTPAVRVGDVHVTPDWKTGVARVEADLLNAGTRSANALVTVRITEARRGDVVAEGVYCHPLGPDVTRVRSDLTVPNHRLWELNDPVLYRVAVEASAHGARDEKQVRFGFRDFRFEDGFFRLNGRRILVKGANHISGYPIGYTVPPDEGMLRRDVLHTKALGYNAIRVGFGGMIARQLDLFDELGILVHQEHFGSWQLQDSPNMALRLDRSIGEVILRDRNHPSVVLWGLLNEHGNDAPFQHVAQHGLALVRALDTTRMAVLNSGRSDFAYELGSLSNPGSNTWDVSVTDLLDLHGYPWVPFSPAMLDVLRTGNHPELIWGVYSWVQSKAPNAAIFLTEYGLCSPMDLPMLVRHYERAGRAEADDAVYLRGQLDKFLADWKRWRLDETWPRPEDYFEQGIRKTAELRKIGDTALRANCRIVGFIPSHVIADFAVQGGGSANSFRELNPALVDSVIAANAPLRWCLLTEPQSLYRGGGVRLDASLANEDMLPAGDYPVRLKVVAPDGKVVWERATTIPIAGTDKHPPFAIPVLDEQFKLDGPPGDYQFVASLESGGAARCGNVRLVVMDPADLPAMSAEVVLWGEDPVLAKWLLDHGVKTVPFDANQRRTRQLILASAKAPSPGGAVVFRELAERMARGSQVVFLDPAVFADTAPARAGSAAEQYVPTYLADTRWLPLAGKGTVTPQDIVGGYYRACRWAKKHPMFDGLPCGGMMDYLVFRNIISPTALSQDYTVNLGILQRPRSAPLDHPAEAICGAIRTSYEYGSGLHIGVWNFGSGRFLVNTLRIRENLGKDPAADRLLCNMLNYMARGLNQPVADLPADFNRQLKAIGYE